jgi:hypothetical protein
MSDKELCSAVMEYLAPLGDDAKLVVTFRKHPKDAPDKGMNLKPGDLLMNVDNGQGLHFPMYFGKEDLEKALYDMPFSMIPIQVKRLTQAIERAKR